MKPLNFLSLFAGFFVLLSLFGIIFTLMDNGDLSAIVSVGLIAIIAAWICAALTIKIRAVDSQNVSKIFKLNFILWFCYWLAKMVIITKPNEILELTFLKGLLLLGISLLGAFFFAKIYTILPKKIA